MTRAARRRPAAVVATCIAAFVATLDATRVAALGAAPPAAGADARVGAEVEPGIPPHPEALEFPPLEFSVPDAADYRRELPGGRPVFLAPSDELPLVTIRMAFRGGAYLEPAETVGLAEALGAMLRYGGTEDLPPDALDRRLDELASDITIRVERETSTVTLDCLSRNLDEAFALLLEMLRHPRFDDERLRLHKEATLERLARRNDDPFSVLRLEMGPLLYGTDHPAGRRPTGATIDAIDRAALRALHARIFHPANLVVAATGDIREGALLSMLATALDGWAAGTPAPEPTAPEHVFAPGLYRAATAQEGLPQGTIVLVRPCVLRDAPDAIALEIANRILGGGMTSRLMRRIRSDEGLAYAAMSQLQPIVHYPGPFLAFAQTKNETVAYTTQLMLAELARLRSEPVTDEELESARQALLDGFPQRFASRDAMLRLFAMDELTGRPHDHWAHYRGKVEAVTVADVRQAAATHLAPEGMAIFVIGDWNAIAGGDPEGRASMNDIRNGDVVHLPLRNPVTLQ